MKYRQIDRQSAYLHAGENQAVADKVSRVANPLGRLEAEIETDFSLDAEYTDIFFPSHQTPKPRRFLLKGMSGLKTFGIIEITKEKKLQKKDQLKKEAKVSLQKKSSQHCFLISTYIVAIKVVTLTSVQKKNLLACCMVHIYFEHVSVYFLLSWILNMIFYIKNLYL